MSELSEAISTFRGLEENRAKMADYFAKLKARKLSDVVAVERRGIAGLQVFFKKHEGFRSLGSIRQEADGWKATPSKHGHPSSKAAKSFKSKNLALKHVLKLHAPLETDPPAWWHSGT